MPEVPEVLSEYIPDVKYIPTFHEAERIAAALPPHRADWFWLALWTGQHPSDVQRMTREDVDPIARRSWVRVRNTKNRRFAGVRIACPAELASVLRARWLELQPGARLVVPWPHVSSQLPDVCERLGLPRYTAKSLRHTFFTWMISKAGITKAVMEIGGWSNFDMVCRVYGHALPPQFRSAVRALDSFVGRRRKKKISVGATNAVGAANELGGTGATNTDPARNTRAEKTAPIRIRRLRDAERSLQPQSVSAEGLEPSTSGLRVCAPLTDHPVSPARFSPAGTGCRAP